MDNKRIRRGKMEKTEDEFRGVRELWGRERRGQRNIVR